MKRVKRLIAGLMTAALLLGLAVLPAAADTSAFPDINDQQVAEAAETLRLLGVVDGTGSGFNPGGNLSRAEFCKMAVEIMGRGDEEPAQRNRTIFLDVGPTYWARGYINLASTITVGGSTSGSSGKEEGGTTTAGDRLVSGVGNGNFEPNRSVTFGEAVTILCRILGYGNSDVSTGYNWYDGYLAVGKSSGLTKDLNLSGADVISRGQAAVLFNSLLYTKPKGSGSVYLVANLGGKLEDAGVVLDADATASDGSAGAIKTTTETYKTDRVGFPDGLEGRKGKAVLDKDGKLIAFQVDDTMTSRTVGVLSATATSITTSGDEKLDVKLDTVAYKDGETKTYKDVYLDMGAGTQVTLWYAASGKLEYLFFGGVSDDRSAMVAKNKPNGTVNPFAALAGGESYTLYKNGVAATPADIRQYDVATYDAATHSMNVSDLRLTGMYENAYPSPDTPLTIKMMGHEFTVLSSATADLTSFKVGQTITLLLTSDLQVAGAVSTAAARGNAVGVAQMSGTTATVKLFNGLEVKGDTSMSEQSAQQIQGQLVNVSSYKVGQLSLSRLSGSGATGTLDVAARTLGGTALAPNVKMYEKVGNGKAYEITFDQLTCQSVPSGKILYADKDYAGRYSTLVFDDVTGDQYIYGFLTTGRKETGSWSVEGQPSETIYNATVNVKSDGKTASDGWENPKSLDLWGSTGDHSFTNDPGGVAVSLDTFQGGSKVAGYVTLKELGGVRRSDFDMDAKTVTTSDMVLPISEHVVCWNENTNDWFNAKDPMEAVNEARAFADTVTIYYDKAPEDGGKVRMIVVEKD